MKKNTEFPVEYKPIHQWPYTTIDYSLLRPSGDKLNGSKEGLSLALKFIQNFKPHPF